ncbi:MAG: SAF domain-containing protein, partial [Dehalococcoidia bacterium]|nr:SAF domain-containing protein [Dehalococcoidia bacterium]
MRRFLNGSMLAAVLLAVLGGGAAYVALGGASAEASGDQVTVLVLDRDVAVGARLVAADLREARIDAGSPLRTGTISTTEAAIGQYA